jgi:hypothetical protein
MTGIVTRKEFDKAVEALWTEIEYQNALARGTEGSEAQHVPTFLTLGQVYLDAASRDWALNEGDELALHGLRKLAAIFVRGMTFCGVRCR